MKKAHCCFCNSIENVHTSWFEGIKQKYSCDSCFKKHFRELLKEEESELLECINNQFMEEGQVKKNFKHDVLSETKRCVKCGKKLKKRIEIEHPNFTKCYRCYMRLPIKGDQE